MCGCLLMTECTFLVFQLEEDFKKFPIGSSPQHIMDEESEVHIVTVDHFEHLHSSLCVLCTLEPRVLHFS